MTRWQRVLGVFLGVLVVGELAFAAARHRSAPVDPLADAVQIPADSPTVDERGGSTVFDFQAPESPCQALRVYFRSSLRGARVDVTGYGRSGTNWNNWIEVPLLVNQRIDTNAVDLRWESYSFRSIRIVVHHHYREPPVAVRWSWLDPRRS